MQKIKQFRGKLKMNQKEFASKTGLSQSYISEIEAGKYEPSLKVLRKISEVLQVPISKLIDD